MFGFGCPICWDKNCGCTHEEIVEYYSKLDYLKPKDLLFTKTKPVVSELDVILKDEVEHIVHKVDKKGNGFIKRLKGEENDIVLLKEPYYLIKPNIN